MNSNLCRLCIMKIEPNSMCNATDVDEIYTKIQLHLNLDINMNDNSVSSVCTYCVEKINQFHEYYQKVHENQEKLIHFFNQMTEIPQKYDSTDFETVTIEVTKNLEYHLEDVSQDNSNTKVTKNQKKSPKIKSEVTSNTEKSTKISENLEEIKNDPFQMSDNNIKTRKSNSPRKRITTNEKNCTKKSKKIVKTESTELIANEGNINNNSSDSDGNGNVDVNKNEDEDSVKNTNETEEFPKIVIKSGKFQIQPRELRRHMQRFFVLMCDICPPQFNNENDTNSSRFSTLHALLTHYKNVHNIKGYVTCCDKKFYRKNMAHHFAFHINPQEYTCGQCGYIAHIPNSLLMHIKRKHFSEADRKTYPCTLCERVYKNAKSLRLHQLDKHPSEDQELKYQCPECAKSFNSRFRLQDHMKNVHIDETFVCDICGKKFRLKSNLNTHLLTHENQKVQCEACGSWLKNDFILRRHFLRNHTSTDLLKCDECDYTTMIKRNLTKHKRLRHSTEKPHSCPYCDHRFKSRSNLSDHITQHTGVKTQCEFCTKEFITKSNYYAHRKKWHFEEIERLNLQREKELLARKLQGMQKTDSTPSMTYPFTTQIEPLPLNNQSIIPKHKSDFLDFERKTVNRQ